MGRVHLYAWADLISSVGTILAGILAWLFGFMIADPVISFLIGGWLLFGAVRLTIKAIERLPLFKVSFKGSERSFGWWQLQQITERHKGVVVYLKEAFCENKETITGYFSSYKEFPAQYTGAIECTDINSGKNVYINISHV